ncbi:arylsulfatase [uncultured Paraglaciecola sp.]|uniref:arylsulfatase n=1 Tax=uncultured Paraglaciecola sp. TaxID=1765024 RepID=UPI0030DB0019|tara:strand:- start:115842 stop:117404 length:1563 start_codon:yes stop_codon:yes gene_type:complete
MIFNLPPIKFIGLLGAMSLSLLATSCSQQQDAEVAQNSSDKPNVIYILVDDMGIGDIEPFGQKLIKTPNLQRMADEGLIFSQHYAGNPVCAPSRAALMTGQHSGTNQIRGNFELGGFADEEEFGQMPLQPGTETVAKVMKKAGYTTALIGKWGLGGPGSYGVPTKQGFDYFFGYLDQKQAHNHYPSHLWENEERFALNNEYLDPHGQLDEDADPNDPASYAKFKRSDFAQQRLTEQALDYIEGNKQKPFFLYLSYAAPHAALQAPDKEIAKYAHFEDTPYDGVADGSYLPAFKPRATRAAMISHIDQGIGLVMDKLKKLGLDENTLVIFSSDNGPSFEGGADLEFFNSNSKFRGYKRDLYDGGIRMPTIARWPTKVPAGQVSDHVSAFWDVLPTLAELVKIEAPKNIDGLSFLPTLLGQEGQQQHSSLYWEFHHWNGSHKQAVRIQGQKGADWKAIRFFDTQSKDGTAIELYNLDIDPQEQINLASEHPDLIAQAEELFVSSRTRSFMDSWNFDYYEGKQ